MLKATFKLLLYPLAFCFGLILTSMVVFKWIDLPTSAFMLAHNLESVLEGSKETAKYEWIDLEEIPESVQIAVITAEDQKFPSHNGIDMDATLEAINNVLDGKRSRGGSTITQQVVKNLYLWEDRSYLRKVLEIPLAMLLELVWDKRRILEVYLNIAQFGVSDFGVKRGSLYQLQKPLHQINTDEAALLAAVLPAPSKFKARYPSRRLANKQSFILRQLARYDGQQYLRALNRS